MTSSRSELFLDLATELLSRGRRIRFRAEGGSMHPTIRGGETIIVEPLSPPDLENGEIALYHSERGITAHRVVAIHEGSGRKLVFITRGDNAGSADEPVEPRQILGKVVAVERQGRSVDLTNRRAKLKFLATAYAFGLKRWLRGASPEVNRPCARLFSVLLVFAAVFAGMARAQQQVTLPASGSYSSAPSGNATGSFAPPMAGLVNDQHDWPLVDTAIDSVNNTVKSIRWGGSGETALLTRPAL